MLVTNVKKRLDIPVEPGQWLETASMAVGKASEGNATQLKKLMRIMGQAQAAAPSGGRGGFGRHDVIGAAEGFDGIVSRPTLFMAGERGAEHVRVTPGGGGGNGGITVNVNVSGHVIGVQDLKDEIRAAVRDGVLAGGFRGTLSRS